MPDRRGPKALSNQFARVQPLEEFCSHTHTYTHPRVPAMVACSWGCGSRSLCHACKFLVQPVTTLAATKIGNHASSMEHLEQACARQEARGV